MFGLEMLSVATLGVLASFVAGVLTLFPALGMTDQRRALVAIATLVVAIFVQDSFVFVSWQDFIMKFFSAAVYAVVSYKLLFQPLVLPAVANGLRAAGVKQAKMQA